MAAAEYPVRRFARLRLVAPQHYWRTGKVQPVRAPDERADPLEAYAPFLFETIEAARRSHAADLARLWEMVVDGDMEYDAALAEADVVDIFACTVAEDGTITAVDPGADKPTIAEARAVEDRRFGPAGRFELTREDIFAAYGVADPAAAARPAP